MSHGKVTPQLRHWIIKQIESGQSPESVLKSLVGNGWPEGAALEVMQRTLRARVAQIRARENTAQSQAKTSGDGPAE
jgi:hypothetical protein